MKLKARDRQDLAVISALLQDALVAVRDMTWQPREKRFVLIANRFCWEAAPEPVPAALDEERPGDTAADARFAETPDRLYSRSFTGLRIERVEQAQLRGLDLKRQRDRFLVLLALTLEENGKALRLTFAEGADIRLKLARISVLMEDLGESWPTQWRPSHSDGGEGSA